MFEFVAAENDHLTRLGLRENAFDELATEGASILLVSSELEEIEALCQRAILLHRGEMIGELHGTDIGKDRILHRLLAGANETRKDKHVHA